MAYNICGQCSLMHSSCILKDLVSTTVHNRVHDSIDLKKQASVCKMQHDIPIRLRLLLASIWMFHSPSRNRMRTNQQSTCSSWQMPCHAAVVCWQGGRNLARHKANNEKTHYYIIHQAEKPAMQSPTFCSTRGSRHVAHLDRHSTGDRQRQDVTVSRAAKLCSQPPRKGQTSEKK